MLQAINRNKQILIGLVASVVLVGCNTMAVRGTGRSYEVTQNIDPITEIEIRGNGELHIQNGNEDQFIVTAQDEIHEYLNIHRRGDRLIVEPKEGYYFKTDDAIKYTLITNNIENITISGALKVISNDYKTETLVIDASGSTDVDMTVTTNQLSLDISGSFDGYLAGNTQSFFTDFSGSADLNAFDLFAEDVDIDVSGASTLYVRANNHLNISAAGAAKIYYKGAATVSQSSAGAVSITHSAD